MPTDAPSSLLTNATAGPALAGSDMIAEGRIQRYRSYFIFALCSSLYLLPFMRLLLQGTDEGTLISGAVRVAHGQVLGRDFFEVIGPGTFYWLAIFFKLFGVKFAAVRICLFLTSLGTGLTMYFLSRRICSSYQALPSALLAGTCFGMLWPAISHHVDSNLFALASVACMAAWNNTQRKSLLVAAGILAGMTTCFHLPKGLLVLLSLLLWLWIQGRSRRVPPVSSASVMVGYFSVLGIALAYFWSEDALWDLVYANVVYPSSHYSAVNVVPYAQGIIHYYWDQWAIASGSLKVALATPPNRALRAGRGPPDAVANPWLLSRSKHCYTGNCSLRAGRVCDVAVRDSPKGHFSSGVWFPVTDYFVCSPSSRKPREVSWYCSSTPLNKRGVPCLLQFVLRPDCKAYANKGGVRCNVQGRTPYSPF